MAKKQYKQIYLNLGKKHLIIFLIGIIILSLLMNIYPSWFGLSSFQFVGCTDGTIEQVIVNKTIYCGQNITELGYRIVDGVFVR